MQSSMKVLHFVRKYIIIGTIVRIYKQYIWYLWNWENMLTSADDLLKTKTIPELRKLVYSLSSDADGKQSELRHMVCCTKKLFSRYFIHHFPHFLHSYLISFFSPFSFLSSNAICDLNDRSAQSIMILFRVPMLSAQCTIVLIWSHPD